jgi:hypothetical protein
VVVRTLEGFFLALLAPWRFKFCALAVQVLRANAVDVARETA